MKINTSVLFALTVLSVVLVSSAFASASDYTLGISNDLSKSVNSTILTITNTNSTNAITVNVPSIGSISDGFGNSISLSQNRTGSIVIQNNSAEKIKISSSSLTSNFALGAFSNVITVTEPSQNDSQTATIRFLSTFCDNGDAIDGRKELEIRDVTDTSSSKDFEWKPLDVVSIDVKTKFISNDSDDSVDAIIEVGLYDTENNEFIDFADGSDDTELSISLDEGDSDTETFKLIVPSDADLVDSSDRYKLVVKVYEDGDQDKICTDMIDNSEFRSLRIKRNTYDVVLDNTDVTTPVPCGQEAQLTTTLENIGTHDEDKVKVVAYSPQLGIINMQTVVSSLDQGDSQKVTFSIPIPQNTTEGTYNIQLHTEFRYRSSSDTFQESSDVFNIPIKVEGSCQSQQSSVQITAQLDSETPQAIAGKQVIVRSTIENTGSAATTYTISVVGNSAWSTVSAIDPQTLTLGPGESKDVSIFLNLNSNAQGDNEFSIRASYAGTSTDQKVTLSIANNGASGNAILSNIQQNWFIYLIILVNIILIIAIILVLRRIFRHRVSSL